jgi:hypothetical protein
LTDVDTTKWNVFLPTSIPIVLMIAGVFGDVRIARSLSFAPPGHDPGDKPLSAAGPSH